MRPPIKRPLVYLFGATVSAAELGAFSTYDLDLKEADASSSIFLNVSRALIFYANSENYEEVIRLFDEYAVNAAQHGNMLIPCASEPDVQKRLNEHILSDRYAVVVDGKREYADFIAYRFLFRSIVFAEIAKDCALWDSGPSAKNSLVVPPPRVGQSPETLSLTEEDAVLLQRAFNDCKSISTETLSDGKSGATVLKVHLLFDAAAYGVSTRPMYAKIDSLQRIKQEIKQYEDCVEGAIPFFMRPNLIGNRCVKPGQGYKKGLLVGNFVENSEPIINAIKRGSASFPIYSLFDHAFRTWRLGSRIEGSISLISSLENAGCVKPIASIPARYISQARQYGLVTSPLDIWNRLRELPKGPHRVGAIHGDLHPGNIHIRGMEPVLIDFYKVQIAPLVYDLAMLEIAIVFDAYPIAAYEFEDWKRLVDDLYSCQAFQHPPEPKDHGHSLENLWTVVRQLRSIAPTLEISAFDYPIAVAFCLLRICTHNDKDLLKAAYGLVAVEKLSSCLENTQLDATP